jgi:LytS/YehU family sensor histidine kinase
MLLNLVENAVKHGTIDQRHPLAVSARLVDGRLEASVRNHGRLGPPPSARPGGLGIARGRLQAVYGGDASLDIVQAGDDVTVAVHLPAQPPASAAD